jgi:hypothetical protein
MLFTAIEMSLEFLITTEWMLALMLKEITRLRNLLIVFGIFPFTTYLEEKMRIPYFLQQKTVRLGLIKAPYFQFRYRPLPIILNFNTAI